MVHMLIMSVLPWKWPTVFLEHTNASVGNAPIRDHDSAASMHASAVWFASFHSPFSSPAYKAASEPRIAFSHSCMFLQLKVSFMHSWLQSFVSPVTLIFADSAYPQTFSV